MQSTRYLAPLIECARRKNHMAPTDKRGMREALLQRQFWNHLTAFVEESRRAEVEQLRRERLAFATPKSHRGATPASATAQPQPRAEPMDTTATAAAANATATKRSKAAKRRQDAAQPDATSSASATQPGRTLPLKKRRRTNTRGDRMHVDEEVAANSAAVTPTTVVTRCTEPVVYTIVRCGPQGDTHPGHSQFVDAAAREFMMFLAMRQQQHQQQQQQQQQQHLHQVAV